MVASGLVVTSPIGERIEALENREAVIDALYRFAAGQDENDGALFESAFAEDAELDFVQPAQRLGVTLAPFKGRESIVDSIMPVVTRLDTTHTVTNPRVQVSGDRASLTALVEAQHLPKGDHGRHLLLKNVYRVALRREAGEWRITHMRIENIWLQGEASVLFPSNSG
jgi:hypothetical protein